MVESFIARWKLIAKSESFCQRVDESRRIISDALSQSSFVVSWSTGKDSTAMLHLVKSIDPHCPIITQFDDCDWPTKREYADRVCSQFGWDRHDVFPTFSVWDRAIKGKIGVDDFCSLSNPLTNDGFILPLEEGRKKFGCEGSFIGLRAGESKKRKKCITTYGNIHRLKSGVLHCWPMANWSADEVFAYHTQNDIPINPLYFNNKIFSPQKIRASWVIPTPSGYGKGEIQHLRIYNPDIFRKLRALSVF